MSEVRFVDTTVRDGQQSLWATNMRTEMMLPVLGHLDRAGFEAIEIHANSFDKKMVRELLENPFERLRKARELVQRTALRIIRGRHLTSFQIAPRSLEQLWYNKIGVYRIQEVRTSDSSNNAANWRTHVEMAGRAGVRTILNLIFSISPRHTDEYYAHKAAEAAAIRPYRICLKDPGALLTPDRLQTLVPAILKNTGDITVEFHTHCNTGLGGLCTLEAIRLGIRTVNTAVPPLANGSSNPSTLEVAQNARILGYKTILDEECLRPVEAHLREVAKCEGLPVGTPQPYDAAHYIHQVPGGMISNLRFQLANAGIADKLPQVLEEIGHVRADFGYPIMVTPYSQFIGAQAMMNVISGERYKTVSDEIIQYALGYWGDDERDAIDPVVRALVLDRPRARQLVKVPPEEPTLEELRRRYGGAGISDEEMIMRIFTDQESVAKMNAAAGKSLSLRATRGIAALVTELSRHNGIGYFQIRMDGLSMMLKGDGNNEKPRCQAEEKIKETGVMSGKFETLNEIEIAKIAQLLEALEKSSFDFLSLELAEFKLTVGKGSISVQTFAGAQRSPIAATALTPAPAVKTPALAPAMAAPKEGTAPSTPPPVEEGLVDVIATTMGHFYSRPEPNAPPFVTLGGRVEPDTTVGLLEVMKLFNAVTAGVSGIMAQICVEDAQLVEFGQVLMRVRPAE
jgi:oxaloacetate decarboxylase alpha subunit